MQVFRLSRELYKDQLSGYGASLNGQRWNSKGTEVIYTADSRALAASEVAVHIPIALLPNDYFMIVIDIPDSMEIECLSKKSLPAYWNAIPHHPSSQRIGDNFVKDGKYAILKVPSVVVKGDYNYILNPRHDAFEKIRIIETSQFPFDPRFLRRMS